MNLSLYSPLEGRVYFDADAADYDEWEEWTERWDGSDIVFYKEEMVEALWEYNQEERMTAKGLMEYYSDYNHEIEQSVLRKVVSAFPTVENIDSTLYGVTELEINEPLMQEELESIKYDITGQFSDGWGEGFEQKAIKIDSDELYISFWNYEQFL